MLALFALIALLAFALEFAVALVALLACICLLQDGCPDGDQSGGLPSDRPSIPALSRCLGSETLRLV
jgi:hypothetical protein